MSSILPSDWKRPNSTSETNRLRELAESLGVPIDAFRESKETQHLSVDEDGTQWFLTLDVQGRPVVRRVGEGASQNTTEETIASFLRRGEGSRQREALIALIDRLFVMHLTD
ncbi:MULTISPECIES: hypothetical protein [Methylobacteriaceae]|uniref:hypothetical protein n=1 Tax=Methylobacteriaceae TaxID=119045 RepID=UPI0011B6BFA3|nr:hypothetical protein [Methylobacterium sp. B4]